MLAGSSGYEDSTRNRAKVPATSKDATRPSKKPALPKSGGFFVASFEVAGTLARLSLST